MKCDAAWAHRNGVGERPACKKPLAVVASIAAPHLGDGKPVVVAPQRQESAASQSARVTAATQYPAGFRTQQVPASVPAGHDEPG
jgi:hypothetical protein